MSSPDVYTLHYKIPNFAFKLKEIKNNFKLKSFIIYFCLLFVLHLSGYVLCIRLWLTGQETVKNCFSNYRDFFCFNGRGFLKNQQITSTRVGG